MIENVEVDIDHFHNAASFVEMPNKVIENYVKFIRKFMSNQKLLFFTSIGRVYTIDPNNLPSGKSIAKDFAFFVDSNNNDKLINVLPFVKDSNHIIASKFSKGFIINSSEILTSQKKGKQLFNLKKSDELIQVTSKLHKYIACIATNKKILIFETKELPKLAKGVGVILIKLSKEYIEK